MCVCWIKEFVDPVLNSWTTFFPPFFSCSTSRSVFVRLNDSNGNSLESVVPEQLVNVSLSVVGQLLYTPWKKNTNVGQLSELNEATRLGISYVVVKKKKEKSQVRRRKSLLSTADELTPRHV